MKHAYRSARLLLVALLLLVGLSAQAQQFWRPFRPGLIYAYREATGSNANLIHTLRVDSAYAMANGDSVYAFNRRLRASTATTFPRGSVKSRNNLFGALMRWRPGQGGYTLVALAQTDVQAPVSLEMFPRAAVGSTWSASLQPLRTATLVSRNWETIGPGVQDSVVVVNVGASGTTTALRISRRHGLLAGPQWLGGATGAPLTLALLPARFEQSVYNPLDLFDVRPGDEFGYEEIDIGMTPIRCFDKKRLRRVLSRRLTVDSLIITYQTQSRLESFGFAGPCSAPAGVAYTPVSVEQWAVARAGNQWQPSGPMLQLGALRLLTGEYVNGAGNNDYLLVGLPIGSAGAGNCSSTASRINYTPYYWQNRTQSGAVPVYEPGLDYAAWQYGFASGFTTTIEGWFGLIYSRKSVNGVVQICGSLQGFANLLPTRAEQAAALATLAPNPALEAATLTLAQPARVGHALRLTDALGRQIWSAPVPAGQTSVSVPLAGLAVGFYVLHLVSAEGTSATWKLNHE